MLTCELCVGVPAVQNKVVRHCATNIWQLGDEEKTLMKRLAVLPSVWLQRHPASTKEVERVDRFCFVLNLLASYLPLVANCGWRPQAHSLPWDKAAAATAVSGQGHCIKCRKMVWRLHKKLTDNILPPTNILKKIPTCIEVEIKLLTSQQETKFLLRTSFIFFFTVIYFYFVFLCVVSFSSVKTWLIFCLFHFDYLLLFSFYLFLLTF